VAVAQCEPDEHRWRRIDRAEFASTNVLIDGGLTEIPIAEPLLPTHLCTVCGVAATVVLHDGRGGKPTLY
jgi:hypothetical protein